MGIFSKKELEYIKYPKKFELENPNYAYVLRHRIQKKIKEFLQIYNIIERNRFLNIDIASGGIRTRDLVLTRLEEDNDTSANIITSFLSSSKQQEFLKYLMDKVNPKLARRYTLWAIDYANYVSNGYRVKEYLNRFTNPNTYNNRLKPIIHLHRFLGLPGPNVKFKTISKDRLIIAPSYEEVLAGFNKVKDNDDLAKFYLFCSTTLLRPQFIITLTYDNIDISNRVIDIRVHRKTKHYRPQIIHTALIKYLQQDKESKARLFLHCYDYYGKKIKRLTGITPSQLRDFAYNAMLKSGMNPLIVEWLMGHDIGISKHYLADDIKYEYTKFERMCPFSIS